MSETNGREDPRLCHLDTLRPEAITTERVGAKAANLMRMAAAGLPVPPGFVLGTEVCASLGTDGHLGDDVVGLVERGLARLEALTGTRFGAARRPLLVSVRSGAAASMPGMLETLLDVGLCDATVPGLLRATGDPAFVWDSYRRLVTAYGEVVEGCPASVFAEVEQEHLDRHGVETVAELDARALRALVGLLKRVYLEAAGRPFPEDPRQQLLGAVEAVEGSWQHERAVEYRRLEGLEDLAGTAVTVQKMVFGNLGVDSGAGVGFTRDPATGKRGLYVDFLLDAQGEDVVAGRQVAGEAEESIAAIEGLGGQLRRVGRVLESLFRDVQDFEFTVEQGRLWLLQTRAAKRTPWAALVIACDLVDEGLIDEGAALDRLAGYDLETLSRSRLAQEGETAVAHAIPASAGVATGPVALDLDAARRFSQKGESAVLVRRQASTDDLAALEVCRGLLTATGARTSHAAVVARQLGVVCAVGCVELSFDDGARALDLGGHKVHEGEVVTLDGGSGEVYLGAVPVVEERPVELLERVRRWGHARARAG